MARGWNWMVCNVPTQTILLWFCDSKTASTATVPVPYRSSRLCCTVGGIPTVRTVCAQCELKLPFAAPPQAAAECRPAFSNIWAPEFCHQPETQLRANLCLPNHLQAKTQPRAGRTCSRKGLSRLSKALCSVGARECLMSPVLPFPKGSCSSMGL